VAWIFAGLLATTGCATTRTPNLTADIASLNDRVAKLEKQAGALGAPGAGVAGAPAAGGAVPSTELAAFDARLRSLEEQIAAVRQRLDDSLARVDSLAQDLQATRELAMRVQPPRTAPTQPPSGDGEGSPSGVSGEPGAARDEDAAGAATLEDTFSAAYADYAKGDYALALAGFQDFLKKYPTSELADNAQFWIAESYYAQGDFETAALQYHRVIEKYPKGDRVPAAMLKQGLCLVELNRSPEGVVLLQHLIQTFPTSDEASLARQRLEEMGVKP
jgi:tol-pal system protein YbgF